MSRFRVANSITAHLKQEDVLQEIWQPYLLIADLMHKATETQEKTIQLSNVITADGEDKLFVSMWIDGTWMHGQLDNLLINDNASHKVLHMLCEFMVVCFLTNRYSTQDLSWLHHKWTRYPYRWILYTILADSQCLYLSQSYCVMYNVAGLALQTAHSTGDNWHAG